MNDIDKGGTRMPVIYIAGPYRAHTRASIDLNIQTARRVGSIAAWKGWSPIIPHANTAHLDEILPTVAEQFWLDATMELMRRCDAVLLCPGWQYSSGTQAEIREAERLFLPVFKSDADLPLASAWMHALNVRQG